MYKEYFSYYIAALLFSHGVYVSHSRERVNMPVQMGRVRGKEKLIDNGSYSRSRRFYILEKTDGCPSNVFFCFPPWIGCVCVARAARRGALARHSAPTSLAVDTISPRSRQMLPTRGVPPTKFPIQRQLFTPPSRETLRNTHSQRTEAYYGWKQRCSVFHVEIRVKKSARYVWHLLNEFNCILRYLNSSLARNCHEAEVKRRSIDIGKWPGNWWRRLWLPPTTHEHRIRARAPPRAPRFDFTSTSSDFAWKRLDLTNRNRCGLMFPRFTVVRTSMDVHEP